MASLFLNTFYRMLPVSAQPLHFVYIVLAVAFLILSANLLIPPDPLIALVVDRTVQFEYLDLRLR